MSDVRVVNLTKKFGEFVAVDDITCSFPEGKVTCLLGPSGCGKTTLLRMISGLETPTEGRVFFGDREVTELPSRKRNIGMVFQYPVVYRGITVRKNIELPLLKGKLGESERRQRVDRVLALLNLKQHADKESSQLDNVARQKVSVARAVAYQPDIILFDEPMTNIDANSKIQFKHAFKALAKQLNQVIVYVTHDQTEAMTLADQIALMEKGKIVQFHDPRTLYNEPEDVFGGWFLGNPGMNFLKERCRKQGQYHTITSQFIKGTLQLSAPEVDRDVTIGIRPEHVRVSDAPSRHSVEAAVTGKTLTIGGQYLYTLGVGERTLKAKVDNVFGSVHNGARAWVELPLKHLVVFDSTDRRVHGSLVLQ
jgi:ABC-type sugar transport system ATPase subunit